MRRIALVACLALAMAAARGASAGETAASNGDPSLLVLDVEGDDIDGAELLDVLDAYFEGTGAKVEIAVVPAEPSDHRGWIELADGMGSARSAVASVWIERLSADGGDFRLAVLAMKSRAVVLMPIELRSAQQVYRRLAAAVRTVFDTDLVGELGEIARVVSAEEPPAPWPVAPRAPAVAETAREPSQSASASTRRGPAVAIALGYLGDIPLREGGSYEQGGRADLLLRFGEVFGVAFGTGYLATTGERLGPLDARQQRVPMRLGGRGDFERDRFGFFCELFALAEIVWIDASRDDATGAELDGRFVRWDSGAGLELGMAVKISSGFGLFTSTAMTGMFVSHRYEYGDRELYGANPFRVLVTAGVRFRVFR